MHAMLARSRGKAQIAPNRRKASMTSDSPARDFRLPHLTALIDDAVAAGYAREVAVAVLIDLITSPRFDTTAPTAPRTRTRFQAGSADRTTRCSSPTTA